MKTIEINSIEGTEKSIEIIVDGVPNNYPALFYAIPQPGNTLVIKADSNIHESIFITNLSTLSVNGTTFQSASEAIVAINELSNFKSGGSSSGNNGGGSNNNITLVIQKNGFNSVITPKKFTWNSNLKVNQVILAKGTLSANFTIGSNSYSHTTIKGITLPAGVDLEINDIEMAVGNDFGNGTLIFNIL